MSIVDTANSLIGKVKYSFGADSIENGVGDCSSFTQYVYSKNGYSIGRTTEQQWKQGSTVSQDNLQAGDLVFFKNTYNSGHTDGVSHVGVYVGNGQFVHNSSSKGVTTSSLSESYWTQHYLGAKRVDGTVTQTTNTTQTGMLDKTSFIGDIVVVGVVSTVCVVGIVFFLLAFGELENTQVLKDTKKTTKKMGGNIKNITSKISKKGSAANGS